VPRAANAVGPCSPLGLNPRSSATGSAAIRFGTGTGQGHGAVLSPVRIGGGNEDQSVIVLGTTETNDLPKASDEPLFWKYIASF